jgi:hydrogenase expression/formation protein HypD
MKYIDEYRDAGLARSLLARIRARVTRPWVLMEICGGQTHTLMRYGIDELLPPEVELVHGPGCPVCVAPLETVDKAVRIASTPGVIFVSYGDMLRVPGSSSDLFRVRAAGGDVRLAYSPLDALKLARQNPDRPVVFFGIGFETTAPAHALALKTARRENLANFSLLASHVLVPPAIAGLMSSPDCRVQAFIAPGHVCTVMGYWQYEPLAARFRVPIVVAGFEPVDLVEAILKVVEQLETGRAEVENQYVRSVTREGNRPAQQALEEVFEVCDRKWRGIGTIPLSGYRIREEFARWDAERVFDMADAAVQEPAECISALVLQGLKKPVDCPAFGARCTPENPLGAPMVSSEGACSAYYQYRRRSARG